MKMIQMTNKYVLLKRLFAVTHVLYPEKKICLYYYQECSHSGNGIGTYSALEIYRVLVTGKSDDILEEKLGSDENKLGSLMRGPFRLGSVMDNFHMSFTWHHYQEAILARNKLLSCGIIFNKCCRV